MRAEEEIQKILTQKKWSLGLAESCTGGLVASRLVEIPGASNYFLGGLVAYSNEAKKELLKVSDKTLEIFGAVSVETAREMAVGALSLFGSTAALAISGIAGPTGGSPAKPVGLVTFAIASPSGIEGWEHRFTGERHQIMAEAAEGALRRLLQHIKKLLP